MSKYYIIKQNIPYLKENIIKVYYPANEQHLKKFISFMIGNIFVYLFDKEDCSRIDLTEKFGVTNFDIYSIPFENINKQIHIFTSLHTKTQYFTIYSLSMDFNNQLSKFYMYGNVYKSKGVEFHGLCLYSDLDEHKRYNKYGVDYELFISSKYENKGFNVELNGIKKSVNDGGLDIIARKDNRLVLVQCKNWSMSSNYKINQKDLRAFVGDCFLYLKNIDLSNLRVSYHFIVSHDNILTKSAEIFLSKNTFLKFKCIPFEKD